MKKLVLFFSISFILFFCVSLGARAVGPLQTPDNVTGEDTMGKFSQSAGFYKGDENGNLLGTVIATIIKGFLSLLAIIFIVLILYAGYNWMTAGGDEQKVTQAKETIQKAIIGLVIIVSAYTITEFVFRALPFGDDPGGVGTGGAAVID